MEPFLGQITLFPYQFTPAGWARCEGQLLPISENQALFSLLGNEFGGDGKTNFALPNLKKATEALGGNVHYAIAAQGIFPSQG